MGLELQDFYNFLLDSRNDPVVGRRGSKGKAPIDKYSGYLSTKKHSPATERDLPSLMNGRIKKKLKIIPKNVK
jgi:serine carboxypeptidase 1